MWKCHACDCGSIIKGHRFPRMTITPLLMDTALDEADPLQVPSNWTSPKLQTTGKVPMSNKYFYKW